MDYYENKKSIKSLLTAGNAEIIDNNGKTKKKQIQHSGIYIFHRRREEDTFKVGLSKSLYNRLNSYKLCYSFPREFVIDYIIFTPEYITLEKDIINAFRKDVEKHPSYSNEWRIASNLSELKRRLLKTLNATSTSWSHLVAFGETGWKITQNTGENLTNASVQQPSRSRAQQKLAFEPFTRKLRRKPIGRKVTARELNELQALLE